MDSTTLIIIGILVVVALIAAIVFFNKSKRPRDPYHYDDYPQKPQQPEQEKPIVEVKPEHIESLAAYVQAQKEQAEAEQRLKDLKKAEMKQKLEIFKQTKETLKDKLKAQVDDKDWVSLETILNSADKGGMGLYILYNETKDKYYVGQAKQLFKRIKDHFNVERIALDYLAGDKMQVKFLLANELDSEYRLDHIEKTGIEIFNSDKTGYNKTTGNL